MQLEDRFSSALVSCVKRSKIDGAKIAGCGYDSGSFGKLLDQQLHDEFDKEVPDGKIPDLIADCFLALTGYISAAVLQVCTVASVMCMAVCGLPFACAQLFTVDSGNTCM